MSAQIVSAIEHRTAVILPFPGTATAAIEHVGGKGYSLIRLSSAGLPVPPGVVLCCRFFEPWIEAMLASAEWRRLPEAPSEWPRLCELLKQQAARLPLNDFQRLSIQAVRDQLAGLTDSELFAVRSSSPQEDVQGASFAGGYETRLGVNANDFVDAIRACFASMFDERVIAYKSARGMRLGSAQMAVVIQAQLDSEVAGVAFSMNPLNNDFDQAVIDASWGQGETVVAGLVTPDHWVIDKITGAVVEHAVNVKQVSRWLRADGGLRERDDYRRAEASLTTEQLRQLLDLVTRIERAFGQPVDIEWAFVNDSLYVLQARPVTAFVPLPPALLTAPGQRRRLYLDIALSSGLTIDAPISPMGLDVFRRLFSDLAQHAFGRLDLEIGDDDALVVFDGGRMYLDLSNAMWLGGPRLMAKKMALTDAMLARILDNVDPRVYRSQQRPVWARWSMLWRLPVAWWRLRRLLGNCLLPFIAPQRMRQRIARQLGAYEKALRATSDPSLPLSAFWEGQVTARLSTLLDVSLASIGPGVWAVQAFARLAKGIVGADEGLRNRLDRGFEGNVVVAMSLEMQRLARLLPPASVLGPERLNELMRAGTLPTSFVEGWADFLRRFGFRGPMEMDIAQPRYADAPLIALNQIAAMAADDNDCDSDVAAATRRQVEARRAAAAIVIARAGPIRRRVLQRLNTVIELFAGLRDTPKQHLLMILHGLRQRIALEGERWQQQGRLDAPLQVFDLNLSELQAADADASLDLRAIRAERRHYYDRLAAQVIHFPSMIDSRGRVLRAPRSARRDGEFSGVGLSPGIVSGPARTLRSPHEKPLLKGEILIAYTTDPGWTPIFANAAAVVLEIGGALQHGAVVARELGLPCVAGIEGVATALKDGQLIEVDGSSGVVRLLPSPTP